MTVHKETPGVWVVHCDLCGERKELDTDPDDNFMEAAKDAREAGFKAKEVTGKRNRREWINVCNDCREAEREKILKEAGLG